MTLEVRAFRRQDRDQLTDLVNAHIGAVVPNMSVSVNNLVSHLEAEPGEFIVDSWVLERRTLVAVQRSRIVAAAHLLRYAGDARASKTYRDAAEIRWLVCWPRAPYWPDSIEAGQRLVAACVAVLRAWHPRAVYADGALPSPGVYGIPEQWPHIQDLLTGAGFRTRGQVEVVSIARVPDLLELALRCPLDLTAVRSLGINGTRFTARLEGQEIGFIEVDTNLQAAQRFSRTNGWADVGNLHVEPSWRRQGVGSWLVAEAARWLDLGEVTRLLDYSSADDEADLAFLAATGFQQVTRTDRGFVLYLTSD